MLTKRIIPVLLLKDGYLVRSLHFNFHQFIGDPFLQLERYNQWDLDELVYIDISSHVTAKTIAILKYIAKQCFMPLTFGGGIKTLKDIEQRLNDGADKVTINTQAILQPDFITQAALEFGQQAIVVSMDVKQENNRYEVLSHHGKKSTGFCPVHWAKEIQARGAGEIFIQSIDRDGSGLGFDLTLINEIVQATQIPVIACSGASTVEDFTEVLTTDVSGAAGANIFLFKELSYLQLKKGLHHQKMNIRMSKV
ncbi:MAG: imidazole glycerol phosphate synthase subunit HisF [Proteobacteria bacterium]|nr:imidazole glycerol phosphate synthase subunit HisF [Pseudomonadota bacterium]